jgi:lysophospholipase L1-like esterase
MALALVMAALFVPSAANATLPPVNQQYLGLGDSLAFGYSSQLYHEGEAAGFEDPERFEHGYVNDLFKTLKAKAVKAGNNLKLVNDGCPGETSASLIGPNTELRATLNAALKSAQEAHGLPPITGESACAYQSAWNAFKTVGIGGPLHHPYAGSQLEDAIATIANAQNVEHKPVTTVTLNIGANDQLHAVAKLEGEAKAFVEAKLAKIGKEAVEAKLKKVAEEAVGAKIKAVAEAVIGAKIKAVAEATVGAKIKKVAEEAINAKVGEHVFIECSEKAFGETGGEEPAFVEKREECLANEGAKLGAEYFAAHQAELEKEGEEAGFKAFGENKAAWEKEGEEAGFKAFGENKAAWEKEGEEAGFKAFFENKSKWEKEGEEAAFAYFAANKAKLEQEGQEAALAYFAAHAFQLNAEGEEFFALKLGETAPALFKQIISNIDGILVAIRNGGSLGLDGGHAVNYTGKIIFQGGYSPFGKLFNLAFEAVQFVNEHGGPSGPFAKINGRCETHSLTQEAEEKRIAEGCIAADAFPFNGLVEILNNQEHEAVGKNTFGACMSFPNREFNDGEPTIEPERLKAWTNMTNASESNGKVNGPDIHPTPLGYSVLAKEMVKETNGKCKKEALPGF